jgi:lysophospholipase L1-like esterase
MVRRYNLDVGVLIIRGLFLIFIFGFVSGFEVNYNPILLDNFSYLNISDENFSLHFSFDVQENPLLNITVDSSDYYYNGTLGNTVLGTQPTWNSSGYIGGAYNFDGVNDYIVTNMNLSGQTPFSYLVMVYLNEIDNEGLFDSGGYGSSVKGIFGRIFEGDVQVGVSSGSSGSSVGFDTNFEVNTWHHLAIVWDGSENTNISLYVDGLFFDNATIAREWAGDSKESFEIGKYGSAGSIFAPFNGIMDEVMIFNRTLNSTEIKELLGLDFAENNNFELKNIAIHTRNTYKKGFDTIDFNFDVGNRFISNPDNPLNLSNVSFVAQYSYDGVVWNNVPNAFYVQSFNIGGWSGCFGDSLTSFSGRWPPTHDGISNTNLSSASGSYLQLGNPGATCDTIFSNNISGNLVNNTVMFLECGANDINANYRSGLSTSENVAEIMADYREIVAYTQQYNVTIHFINIVAGDYTGLIGDIIYIDESDTAKISAVKETNSQAYDYYRSDEHNETIISYSDVWTPSVDTSNNLSVLPAYGTLNSYHPSVAGNLVYADAVWSDNYKHKIHEKLYASYYPEYPSSVKFKFNITASGIGSVFHETDYYFLNFFDNESACSSEGRFWYSGLCNLNPQTIESITEQQKGGGTIKYVQSSMHLKQGFSKLMAATQKVQILINDEEKIIEIKDVDSENDEVEFLIGEENYTVGLENSTKIDTNDDGFYDLEISVFKVQSNGYAELEFKEIYEEVPKEIEEEVSEEVKEIIGEKDNFIYYVLGGIVFLCFVVWLIIFEIRRAKKMERKYKYWKGMAKKKIRKKR